MKFNLYIYSYILVCKLQNQNKELKFLTINYYSEKKNKKETYYYANYFNN